jgi:hypothetical protein
VPPKESEISTEVDAVLTARIKFRFELACPKLTLPNGSEAALWDLERPVQDEPLVVALDSMDVELGSEWASFNRELNFQKCLKCQPKPEV